jgi:hypothetical protein
MSILALHAGDYSPDQSLFVDSSRRPANYYDYLIMLAFERHNIDITVLIMKQRSEL